VDPKVLGSSLEIDVLHANADAGRFHEGGGLRPWAVEYFGSVPPA